MSAPDDKISNNRRRLFKALSTAPVVMTLKPGAALANASAYQCLGTKYPQTGEEFLKEGGSTTVGCDSADPCFAYRETDYWDTSQPLLPGALTPIDDSHWPSLSCLAIDTGLVIKLGPSEFLDLTGNPVDFTYLQFSGDYIELLDTHKQVCAVLARKTGLALIVGEPGVFGGEEKFVESGLYPKFQLTGTQQGITGTCLGSVPPALKGAAIIAKG